MSVTDPADIAQPEEGQGDTGTADAPYAEYLSRIPEEVRGDVEPIFKDWDANVTRRFQDHSEFRKSWEPYQDLGVNKLAPDEVAWALQFREAAAQNPQAVKEWYEQYAQQNNLIEQAQAPPPDEFAFQDPNAQFEQMLKAQLSPLQQQVEQMSAWRAQQEQQAQQAEGARIVESQMADLKAKHGEFNRDMVEHLALKYVDTDPTNAIPRAFTEYQAFVNAIEKQALQAKVDQPAPAETGGPADLSPEKITSFKQAEEVAAQYLRNNR